MVAALSIGAASWLFGRSIGTSRFLDSQHKVLTVEFGDFESALLTEMGALCATGSIRNAYFDQSDVGLIGILDAAGRNPRCQMVRETPVTPLSVEATEKCSAVIVNESHLSWAYPGVMRAGLGPAGQQVSRIAEWRSSGGDFGFDIYRKSGCEALALGTGALPGSTMPWSSP